MAIQTLGPPPLNTSLTIDANEISLNNQLPLSKWLNLIYQTLAGVGPTFRKVADVTFPPCPPNSSIDVTVAFPGAKPASNSGDIAQVVTLGLSLNMQFTANNGFLAFISAVDVVTIREFCVDVFGIGGFTDTFTIMISTGTPNIP